MSTSSVSPNEPLPGEPSLHETLNAQTAKIPWSELQRPFASGAVFELAKGNDLVKVAVALAEDDAATISPLVESNAMLKVEDERAQQWAQDDTVLWCVVVAPYVLVQEPE